ncbi:short-chain fatty acyl-CoA regulator family protein [Streptomyces silvensis]|uniref:Short-chain fatty acyl coenzyme A regulators C-terminal domain-containing protein n=1 Tax=Streptomyces silvensis TaxID=1765722 RepID=A0A0W7X799_9ACTN|nr:short-chain fatty acyl-CoA regulator family protein [Streptomyces silvensis]KUF18672.1 hypothetical protein AT728_06300 [Streptomyces silvensis]
MLHTRTTPARRRRALRAQLASGQLLRMPGAINPYSAKLIQEHGFEAAYLSGAVLAAELCLPDIGLTASTEIAIGLGCEIRHAPRLVYSDGLDLASASSAVPIGMGCRLCERTDCPQRAVPPLDRRLAIDENSSSFVPYPVAGEQPGPG